MVIKIGRIVRSDGDEIYHDDLVIDGEIDGQSVIDITTTKGNIFVNGKIDGQSTVKLEAMEGSITIRGGKIDGQCKVKLSTRSGPIIIKGKIGGGSYTQVYYFGGNISVIGSVRNNIFFGKAVCQYKNWAMEDSSPVQLYKKTSKQHLPIESQKTLHCVRIGQDKFVLKDYKNKQFHEAFQLFDTKKTGVISYEQVKMIVENFGFSVSNGDLFENSFDRVTYTTYMELMTSKVVSRDSDDDFARTFNFFHSEKASDKFIDATKFYEICVATGEKMTEGEIRGLIKELDTDGDGRLSFEEFRAAMMEAYAIER